VIPTWHGNALERSRAEHRMQVPGHMTLHAARETYRGEVARLLANLIAKLDTAPRSEILCLLAKACDAAIETSLEGSHLRPAEPAPPTRSELASLLELLVAVDCREAIGVLRQIRRVIGRLDCRPQDAS